MRLPTVKNLACPIDGGRLALSNKQWSCTQGHSYDVAKQGYVNLLPVQLKRSKNPGDSKAMVVARTEFLDTAVYEPIAKRLSELCASLASNDMICICDAGCGEGYYLNFLQQQLEATGSNRVFSYIGVDISKPAITAATRRNQEISWVVGTNRQLPIEEYSVDIILCVFGFQNLTGFSKILKKDGVVVLIEPGLNHLNELKRIIYPEIKKQKSEQNSDIKNNDFSVIESYSLQYKSGNLNNKQINNLLLMTPHLFRASHQGKETASQLQTLNVEIDVVFTVLQKKLLE